MNIEQIAKVCHEANRAYCESIGDESQLPWNDASEWQRKSAISGVEFRIKNPNSTPESQHVEWFNDKIRNGWKHGLVKDADKKEHPCLVLYSQLPESQKLKDALFIAVVDSLKGSVIARSVEEVGGI